MLSSEPVCATDEPAGSGLQVEMGWANPTAESGIPVSDSVSGAAGVHVVKVVAGQPGSGKKVEVHLAYGASASRHAVPRCELRSEVRAALLEWLLS